MKHLILIILSLVVFECQAQESKLKKLIKNQPVTAFTDSTISAYGYRKGEYPNQSFTSIQPFLINGYSWTTLNKTAMTISNPDSTGKISVYINKKEIKWTSDSTFVIETK